MNNRKNDARTPVVIRFLAFCLSVAWLIYLGIWLFQDTQISEDYLLELDEAPSNWEIIFNYPLIVANYVVVIYTVITVFALRLVLRDLLQIFQKLNQLDQLNSSAVGGERNLHDI